MDYLMNIWNQVVGSTLVEPTAWVFILFLLFFVAAPIVALYIGIKIAIWLATEIRDWWNYKE